MGYAEEKRASLRILGKYSVESYIELEAGFAEGGERALLTALLFDGVQAYMNYLIAKTPQVRERYYEAFDWVNRKEADYVFSFDNVCEALGIDAAAFRNGVTAVHYEQCEELAKARRHF